MPKPNDKNKDLKSKRSTAKTGRTTKTQKVTGKKKVVAADSLLSTPRRLQAPKAIWYKPLTWRHRPPVPPYKPLPKARILFWNSMRQLWQHRILFAGIAAIYGLLNVILVRGISGSSNLDNLKAVLGNAVHGFGGKVLTSAGSFVYLLSTSGSGNTAGSGIYQSLLLLVCSLAFIWVLRQTLANHKVRIRDGFYQGMYPFVPFMLVFMLLGLQLLPLVLGGAVYGIVTANGIAAHWWEHALWLGLFISLGLWSLRMATATIFALYIVTLPDMTPMHAYKSARQLVYGRRLLLWRKLLFLPLVLLLVAAVIEMPLIFFATAVAPWVLFVFSMVALPAVHGYLYNLYREML